MLKIGYLVPVTVVKALPDYTSYLMAIPGTELMALLERSQAGSHLRIGDNTIAAVHSIEGGRIHLSQKSAPFYRRLTEMLLSPLIFDEKVKVVHAAAVNGADFAKIAVAGMNGCNPIAECLPYIKPAIVHQYTKTSLTLVKYSPILTEYVVNAFAPAPKDDILEVIHFRESEEVHVIVKSGKIGMFVGKGGANVATVAKLTNIRVYVRPVS
jgi:N utilization substance protein A